MLGLRTALLVLAAALAVVSSSHRAMAQSGTASGIETGIAPPPTDWISTLHRDHPLVGKLWASERRQFVALELLPREILFEDLVLLGEVHDNPDHHHLRAWMIAQAFAPRSDKAGMAATKPPALVLEHVRIDQADVLASKIGAVAAMTPLAGAKALLEGLDWSRSGWPDQAMFEPLFAAALANRLRLVAGNVSRESMRAVARTGATAISDAERGRLRLDVPLASADGEALLAELEASHCGLMPKSAFTNMAVAQRYRDAHLALRMAEAVATEGSALLITGNGHVRSDRGVPWYLRRMLPDRKFETVMLIEVDPARTDPTAYVETGADGRPVASYVLFTPKVEREDPCVEMKRMFQNRATGGGATAAPPTPPAAKP